MNFRGVLTLVAPRPLELLVKGPILLGAAVVAALSPTDVQVDWKVVLIGGVLFEFGFYQGRYLINDVIDVAHDRIHPAAASRARLAGFALSHARPLALAGIVRMTAAAALVVLVPSAAGRGALWQAMAATVVVALLYETVRQRVRERTGAAGGHLRRERLHDAVYVAVGLGYAIRVVTGMRLAGLDDIMTLTLAGILGWAFGIMFVTMTWVLEASAFSPLDRRTAGLQKSHVVVLGDLARRPSGPFDATQRVLSGPAPWRAPWFAMTVVASSLSAALGAALLDASWLSGAVAGAAGAVGGAIVARSPTPLSCARAAIIVLATQALLAAGADLRRPLLAATPGGVVLVTHLAFRILRAVDIGLRPAQRSTVPTERMNLGHGGSPR